jgi:hypothetical protein
MGQSTQAIDRLKDYLAQLSPKAQALLMRQFERAVEQGENVQVASFVLEQLRLIVRSADDNERFRTDEPSRMVLRPLEAFLVDNLATPRPGQIKRSSLVAVWNWIIREAAVNEARELAVAVKAATDDPAAGSAVGQAVRKVQLAAAAAIDEIMSPAGRDQRALSRIGGQNVAEDLIAIATVLKCHEALETFSARMTGSLRNFDDSEVAAVQAAMNTPSLLTSQAIPFTLSLLMQRLAYPWQVIRLAVTIAGSDDEIKVAATTYGIAVTMVIHDLFNLVTDLRQDMKRGRLNTLSHRLKTIHDALRGLRTELDIRTESTWGRRLSAVRAEISSILKSEIENVPGRVRRLLRQRPEKDIHAGSKLDPMEIDETAELIDFVAICRTYASELAINEVTLRTYSDLQHYTETATEALVESLRGSDSRTRAFRQMQMDAAVRFCDVLFGQDYASLMKKAADLAIADLRKGSGEQANTGDRKSSRAS